MEVGNTMTEDPDHCRSLWAAVVLLAYRDIDSLALLNQVPEEEKEKWQRIKKDRILQGGDPVAWIEGNYYRQIMGSLGISTR